MTDDAAHKAPQRGLVLRPLPALRRALALLRAPGCVALVPRVRLGVAARAGRAAGAAAPATPCCSSSWCSARQRSFR